MTVRRSALIFLMKSIAHVPFNRPFHIASTLLPRGDMHPSPVTTTLFMYKGV